MKKLITLLLLFTLVGFLSGNQVVITNNYEYIVSEGKTYNFNNGNESNNVKYDRTNKIQIQNNKIIANPLSYHYAFFWNEADAFIGYYKTNKGITTSGAYLGQVNTQSIPLPLNAYSFALVRYDNDYEVVNGITIEDIFINSDNYFDNTIEWNFLDNLTLNKIFNFETLSVQTNITLNSFLNQTFNQTFTSQNYLTNSVIYLIDIEQNGTDYRFRARSGSTDVSNTIRFHLNGLKVYQLSPTMNFDRIIFLRFVAEDRQMIITSSTVLKVDGILTITDIDILTTFYQLFNNISTNNFIYTGYSTDFINPTFGFDNKLLNLTEIFGAGNEPNQATIEQYYDDYLEYLEYLYVCCNIFATQTISFETIYFDDGVSTEIEQLGSILIFTLIGFTLMIFGFASKRRIFNLLAVGAFVVLGFLLIEFVGFIIILFGLIFVNVYYTFFGEL